LLGGTEAKARQESVSRERHGCHRVDERPKLAYSSRK